jgi:hypothetical protein
MEKNTGGYTIGIEQTREVGGKVYLRKYTSNITKKHIPVILYTFPLADAKSSKINKIKYISHLYTTSTRTSYKLHCPC